MICDFDLFEHKLEKPDGCFKLWIRNNSYFATVLFFASNGQVSYEFLPTLEESRCFEKTLLPDK